MKEILSLFTWIWCTIWWE